MQGNPPYNNAYQIPGPMGAQQQGYQPQQYPAAQPGYPMAQTQGYPTSPQSGYPMGMAQPQGYPTSPQSGYPMNQAQNPSYPITQPQPFPVEFNPQTMSQAPGYLGSHSGPAVCPPGPQGQTSPGYAQPHGMASNNLDISQMQPLPGYEGISFNPTPTAPPPPNFSPESQHEESKQTTPTISLITEDDAREALIKYSSSNCCFGAGPAKSMQLGEINYKSTFHYTLESYTEKRETFWEFEPFKTGKPMACGIPVGPWDINVPGAKDFQKGSTKMEVPNTGCLKPCHGCMALGRKPCNKCFGCGHINCTWCEGKGTRFSGDKCTSCDGNGRDSCRECRGNGHKACDICKEKKQLRFFVSLKVTWTVNKDDFISDSTTVPDKLIKRVTGQVAFEDEGIRVYPATNFPDPKVCSASQELVSKHNSTYAQEKILKQRHKVQIIPIAEVNAIWKSEPRKFTVYGFEHMVFFPDYPAKCCCGCNII